MKISIKQIQLVTVLYLVAWMIAPPLAYGTIFRVLAIFAALLWSVLQIINNCNKVNNKVDRYLHSYVICVSIYCFFLFTFRCVFDRMDFFQAFYNDITTYILLFNGYIGGIYYKEKRYKDLKYIFYFSLLLGTIFSITSVFRSSQYYVLTRNAGGDMTNAMVILAQSAAKHGVGTFGFFSFTSVFSPIVFLCSFKTKNIKKIILLIAFIFMELGVISAGYTIALLISFVGIGLVLFFRTNNLINKLIIMLITILFIIFWSEISSFIFLLLKQITADTMYENKVNDIFGFLVNGESIGSFAARQERYIYSLQSIFNYPVFGSYIIQGTRAVGYHSSILDTFAAYGWIIGSIFVFIIIIYPIKIAKIQRKEYNLIIFILLFLTSLFNTYTMMMGIFYYLIPGIPCLINNNQEIKK